MRNFIFLGLLMSVFSGFLVAQAPEAEAAAATPPLVRDPQAIAIIQAALAAMGGEALLTDIRDTITRGTLTQFGGTTRSGVPITIKTMGNNRSRTEITEGGRQRVHIHSRDVAWTIEGASRRLLPFHTTYNKYIQHIPLFSELSQYSDPNVSLKYLGTGRLGSAQVHILSWLKEDTTREGRALRLGELTYVEYYINQTTFLPLRMRYFIRAPNHWQTKARMETAYADYRRVGNALIPFQVDTYFRDKLISTLQITGITFNNGLLDQEFRLP